MEVVIETRRELLFIKIATFNLINYSGGQSNEASPRHPEIDASDFLFRGSASKQKIEVSFFKFEKGYSNIQILKTARKMSAIFNTAVLYKFILANEVLNMYFVDYDVEPDEEFIGFDAYECYDERERKFIYYISQDHDMYDFGAHFLKLMDGGETFVVCDIVELSEASPYVPTTKDAVADADETDDDETDDIEQEPAPLPASPREKYAFDYFSTYKLFLDNDAEVDVEFQRENENDIYDGEELDGYTAYECYDNFKNRYVYYVNQEYDLYDFAREDGTCPHFIMRYDDHAEKLMQKFGVVDILEL